MLNIKNVEIKSRDITKDYRFLHLSDLHMSLCDDRATERQIKDAVSRNINFTKDGISPDKRFEEYIEYIKERSDKNHPEHLDGVLFTGDVLDFPSQANFEFLEEKMGQIEIPVVFALGNHDWIYFHDCPSAYAKVAFRPLFSKWCGGNTFINKTYIGELCFITLDNVCGYYEDGLEIALEKMMENEKNVIIMQHIPFYVDTLHGDVVARWKRDGTIGGEALPMNDTAKKIYDLIVNSQNSVLAVLTGHFHFHHVDMLTENIVQLVTDIAARANASLVTIKQDK